MSALTVNPTSLVATAMAALVSAGLGWLVAGMVTTDSGSREEVAKSERESTLNHRPPRFPPPASVQVELDRIMAAGSPIERMRATIALAQEMTLEEFENWIEGGWFDYREGFELTLFHRIGIERWKAEDPLGYVAWARERQRWEASELMAEWIGEDRERFEKYFSEHPDSGFQLDVLMVISMTNSGWALEKFGEFVADGRKPISFFQYMGLLEYAAESSTEQLEAMLGSFPLDIRQSAERALITARLKKSFHTEIASLMERPDGWNLLVRDAHEIEGMGDKMLEMISDLPERWREQLSENPEAIVYQSDPRNWLRAPLEDLGFSEQQGQALRFSALKRLTQLSPREALTMLGEAGLSASQRKRFVRGFFDVLDLGNESESAEEWIGLLGSEEDRTVARQVVAEVAESASEGAGSLVTPETWMARAAAGHASDVDGGILSWGVRHWETEQIEALRADLAELDGEVLRHVSSLFTNIQNYAHDERTVALVGDALRYQISQDEERGIRSNHSSELLELASLHAAHWVIRDPASAQGWVDSLPEGPARVWARGNMAATWTAYDAEAAADWIRTLPAGEREAVEGFVENRSDWSWRYVE